MRSEDKTKEQLIGELLEAHRRIAELEESGIQLKKAEAELREAQKYSQDIINSSLDMIIAVDKDRKIIEFNEAAQRTFGYSREEVLGKHVGILYGNTVEGSEVHHSTRATGQFTGEAVNRRKSGEAFTSFISASVLHDTMGRFIGFMGISRDITEQKRTEERLRESEKLASLGRLVAGAAHELNNPVSLIYSNMPHLQGYIQDIRTILERYEALADVYKSPAPQIAEAIAKISDIEKLKEQVDLEYIMNDLDRLTADMYEGARRTKAIVENLRAFSRLGRARIEDTDINEDIEKSLSLLVDYYKDRITIHKDYGDIPRVKCYTGQIIQVFANVITNACQAIESQGDIWIRTRLENNMAVISIRDNGVGIAKEHIDKVFDPFFTTREVGEGTGLGLSISYGITQRHSGEILVDSQEGSGTTFTIQIPVDFENHELHG